MKFAGSHPARSMVRTYAASRLVLPMQRMGKVTPSGRTLAWHLKLSNRQSWTRQASAKWQLLETKTVGSVPGSSMRSDITFHSPVGSTSKTRCGMLPYSTTAGLPNSVNFFLERQTVLKLLFLYYFPSTLQSISACVLSSKWQGLLSAGSKHASLTASWFPLSHTAQNHRSIILHPCLDSPSRRATTGGQWLPFPLLYLPLILKS